MTGAPLLGALPPRLASKIEVVVDGCWLWNGALNRIGWDERALELGNPATMDAPTLVEWIQRQLETSEETAERHREERRLHRAWHETNPGGAIIAGCCLRMADF